jgi:D-glycero-D-manno-heptose 1,7-bisphosphate phosphatase
MTSPRNWDEIRHFEGLAALPRIKEAGYKLILITNQPDVERGIIEETFLMELHTFYTWKYGLDKVYYCPFSSNDHPWKKPNPGMFHQAARDFGLTLSECFHLGDTDRDVLAARNCGCKGILWDRPYNQDLEADYRVENLAQVREILGA